MSKNRIIGFVVLGIIGLIISQFTGAKRDDSGQITKSGDIGAFETHIGDCLKDMPNIPDAGTSINNLNAIPCNEAHHWQVFYKSSINLSTYSEQGVIDSASSICNSGIDALWQSISSLKASEYGDADITYLHPTSESWNTKGDRAVDCLIGSDTQIYYSSVLN